MGLFSLSLFAREHGSIARTLKPSPPSPSSRNVPIQCRSLACVLYAEKILQCALLLVSQSFRLQVELTSVWYRTDYIGISDESRASIRMTYDAAGPTVSQSEAQRIEQETAHRLLDSRKLILIVDLDQTIVHATVDPTVGEWMAQGEAYKKRKLAREAKVHARAEKKAAAAAAAEDDDEGADSSSDGASDDDDDDEADKEDEVNPNWAMLEDVHTFKLGPDPVIGHPQNGHVAEQPGCDYYIKSRYACCTSLLLLQWLTCLLSSPGLKHLLEKLMEKYEMHVYTMGTRAYALQVCKAIDPEGTIFNERILTRDESGSKSCWSSLDIRTLAFNETSA